MPPTALAVRDPRDLLRSFGRYDRLGVRQGTSMTEVILSWEERNRYEVSEQTGRVVLAVREAGSGLGELLGRMLLGPARPCRLEVVDAATGAAVLDLRKPFRLFLPKMVVHAADGEVLGTVERRFSWPQRRYVLRDHQTGEEVELTGVFWKPWRFTLRQGGLALGEIQKRWRGLTTELLTDADDFAVDLSQIAAPQTRALAFSATLLIDLVHFERAKG